MTKVNNINIHLPQDVSYIIEALENADHEAYIVGGCVRDILLGNSPKDWDITTNAKPDEIIEVFEKLNHKVLPTGIQHGTVTVMINDTGYEITTYRIDGEYNDGRHPETVEFVSELKKDLSRRDFTINAMAYNHETGLIDYFNGQADLKDKIIRCVGLPSERFNEDALRMMRALRFSAQLGFKIRDLEKSAISLLANNLESVSRERIREELNKIIVTLDPNIMALAESKLLEVFIPEIKDIRYFEQNNPYHNLTLFNHTIQSIKNIEPAIHLRLTMLLHDIGKPKVTSVDENGIFHYYAHVEESVIIAEKILNRLKYDRNTIDRVLILIANHDKSIRTKRSIKRMLNKIGEENLRDLINVKWADVLAQEPRYAKERIRLLISSENILNEIILNKECFSLKDLAVNGHDLIALGIEPGKMIGIMLNRLLSLVLEDEALNDKEALLNVLNEVIVSAKQ